jgi:hypothetical protein
MIKKLKDNLDMALAKEDLDEQVQFFLANDVVKAVKMLELAAHMLTMINYKKQEEQDGKRFAVVDDWLDKLQGFEEI